MSERLGAAGVNLLNSCGAAAWQTVFHFHIHVIPRYEDDPLRLPWTPAPGDPDEIAAAALSFAESLERAPTPANALCLLRFPPGRGFGSHKPDVQMQQKGS